MSIDYNNKKKGVLPSGFEPESSAYLGNKVAETVPRKAEMIGRATLQEQICE